jgi:cyclopropane fatty-acyl-phospholipid synthase-like methyltransferase
VTGGSERDIGDTAASVRAYYERNTRLFLALGVGRQTLAMRRAVWADGVESLPEAVDYVNGLIAAEARSRAAAVKGGALHVLDIGCGVGGSLLFLADSLDGPLSGIGVTISPRQADFARRQAAIRGLSSTCTFLAADFSAVGSLPPVHLAFAIESAVHFAAPAAFYSSAARALAPGGRLIVVDDFIVREGERPAGGLRAGRGARHRLRRRERLLDAFRRGWLLPSLCTFEQAVQAAQVCGLRMVEERSLGQFLATLPLNVRLGGFMVRVMDALPVPWPYWRSSVGSLALACCQRAGLVDYRYAVFEKPAAPSPGCNSG